MPIKTKKKPQPQDADIDSNPEISPEKSDETLFEALCDPSHKLEDFTDLAVIVRLLRLSITNQVNHNM